MINYYCILLCMVLILWAVKLGKGWLIPIAAEKPKNDAISGGKEKRSDFRWRIS